MYQIADIKNVLLQKYGKVPYKAQLQSSGMPFISVADIRVLKKTASGPVSGSVCEAIWKKPNGEEVSLFVLLGFDNLHAKCFNLSFTSINNLLVFLLAVGS